MVEVKHVDVEPPSAYDEKRIKKDLIQLSVRGYSLVPYQSRIKSKLYYSFHKKRIDAFFELVEAEREVWRALKEWRMALEELKMVDVDIEKMMYDKLLERDRKKQEYEDFTKDSAIDSELKDLRKRKEILDLKHQLAQLEKKLDSSSGEQTSKIEQDTKDAIAGLEAVAEVVMRKKEIVNQIKKSKLAKGLSEDEINQIIEEFESMSVKGGFIPDTSKFK